MTLYNHGMNATAAGPAVTREEILRAGAALAAVCDGAVDRDGHGYNGVDSRIAKSILAAPAKTDRQVRALWHILRKYRKQLEGRGFQYEALVPPALPSRDERGQFQPSVRRLKLVWIDTQYGRRIALVFGYDMNLVNIARGLEKRWFDQAGKQWLIPDDVDHLDNALAAFEALEPPMAIEIDPALREATDVIRTSRKASLTASHAAAPATEIEIPTKLPLLPFQKAGVEFIDAHGGRALVADEMGLGKTCQAIGWLALRRERALPALVVVPAVVRVNWIREIAKFSDLKAMVVVSKSSLKSFQKLGIPVSDKPEPGYDIVIVNYDLCRADYDVETRKLTSATINKIDIKAWPAFKTVVFDEAHALKEAKSQRTRVGLALASRTPHVILLTGTPLLNRPKEIWTLSQACNVSVFPKFFPFAQRYCGARKDRFGWDFNGATHLDELARILRERVMVRREKMDVLKELPDRRRVTFPVSINGHMADYDREAKPILENLAKLRQERDAWKIKVEKLDGEKRTKYLAEHAETRAKNAGITGHMIAEITKLRQIAGLAKVEPATDFLLDTIESAGKVIVFAHHHTVIDAYVAKLTEAKIKVEKLDGREAAADRQTAIDRFQDGDAQVIVMSIGAGGVGINLQAASNVVFVELPWRPGDVDQAEARAWRMGQKNAVSTYFLVGLGTIEESIAKVIDAKREVTNAVVGETDRSVDEDGIMDTILEDLLE